MKRRYYRLWHQDSPGSSVVVHRWFFPRSAFCRVGESCGVRVPRGETVLDARRYMVVRNEDWPL